MSIPSARMERVAGDAAEVAADVNAEKNRKKKEKKKEKVAAKLADASAKVPALSDTAAPAGRIQKGMGNREKAIAAKAATAEQARLLQQQKEEHERKERERIAEEKRLEDEAFAAAKQRQLDRAARRKARIEEQKADGTYLHRKEKDRLKEAARLRAYFGKEFESNDIQGQQKASLAGRLKRKKANKPDQADKHEADKPDTTDQVDELQTAGKAAAAKEAPDDWEKLPETDTDDATIAGAATEDESRESEEDELETFQVFRSPITCVMGHVDTGKTKLLDKIRRTHVQEGEAGGITQQIGATFFPTLSLQEQTDKVDPEFHIEVPGMMIIDTPGHGPFRNLRTRGSSLCDIAVLVIDIMHGLEPQTIESLEILKERRCPFIIALNKVDRLYGWQSHSYTGIRGSLEKQPPCAKDHFHTQWGKWNLQLQQRGFNCSLYWDNIANNALRDCVSVVPTSALTGEGVPDLLFMLLNCCQTIMPHRLEVKEELQCTVIEVKNIEGMATTIDVVLVNGNLKEGDKIVIGGLGGAIDTTIKALLTPHPMKEMRVKGSYAKHTEISTSMGIKILANGLEHAIAGSELRVVGPNDILEDIKEEVQDSCPTGENALLDFDKEPEGVFVKASTLGSLEALLVFLKESEIPVAEIGIGDVQKKDVRKATQKSKGNHPAMILAFDVKVKTDAKEEAETEGLPVFTADIIYHLFDKYKAHMDNWRAHQKEELKDEVVFPVIMKIDQKCVFRKTGPVIVGGDILRGQLRVGTPICVPDKGNLNIGKVASIQVNEKDVHVAKKGARCCVKIESHDRVSYGRHFDHTNELYSQISRPSIDALKKAFQDEMEKDDWSLLLHMKKKFQIQ